MSALVTKPNSLLMRAIEAVAPLTAEYAAGMANGIPDVTGAVERAALRFREKIADCWLNQLRQLPPDEGPQLLASLAGLTPDQVRATAEDLLDRLAPWARVEDRAFALDYLAAIPGAVQRALVPQPGGGWKVPGSLVLDRLTDLARLLPDSAAMQPSLAAWTSRPADAGELQKTQDSPLPVLPALERQKDPVDLRKRPGTPPTPSQSMLAKLHILSRCHAMLARERLWRKVWQIATLAVVVILGGFAAGGLGAGVYHLIYESPERQLQRIDERGWDKEGRQVTHTQYFIRGEEVSRQQYEYFRQTYDGGHNKAIVAALAAGIVFGLLLLIGWWVLMGRPARVPQLEEQVQAIVRDHPDSVQTWGGPAVLRERELVDEILRLEEART
jgi:hypothetical protein